ncbi:MAG: hypothetical protein J6C28_01575 [Bacilli bacterium]|nr:hypothetical protein [Bacilli bacterium]
MERSRKRKIYVILILMFTIASLSIGFAAFSGVLNISSSATVSVNGDLFSVKFSTEKESLVVSDVKPSSITSGITASDGIIDNSTNPMITNLSASFTKPGQYVEYTFYARNEGVYIAYLNNVNFIGEKVCQSDEMTSNVQSACDSIDLKVFVNSEEYSESTRIDSHYLDKNTGEEVIVRIEYASDGGWSDAQFNVTFPNVVMVYSTINDSAFIPEGLDISGPSLLSVISQNVASDSSLDLSTNPDTTLNNIPYIRSGTESQEFPIYYYRGNVTNNHVRFAGFCWKIVRTTDTGGVKIIYNGFPVNGSCSNTGEATHIALSAFNDNTSPTYVGYMYGDVYLATEKDMSSQSATYIYGNDVNWDGSSYTLVDTKSSSSWSTDYSSLSTYHYTCFNSSGTCTKVYYINSYESSTYVYYLTLENGRNIDDAKIAMFANKNNSTAKSVIDGWFANFMIAHVDSLEDTVFCNDRTLVSGPLYSKDNSSSRSYFKAYNISTPVLTCSNTRDSFTVNSTNGNGMLTYPVGLLTSSEYKLAGVADGTYLDNDQTQWTMSPYYFNDINADMASITTSMTFDNERVEEPKGIRPVVSLKPGIQVFGGDGSATMPYLVIE